MPSVWADGRIEIRTQYANIAADNTAKLYFPNRKLQIFMQYPVGALQ